MWSLNLKMTDSGEGTWEPIAKPLVRREIGFFVYREEVLRDQKQRVVEK